MKWVIKIIFKIKLTFICEFLLRMSEEKGNTYRDELIDLSSEQ